ncbi:MAG: NAD(P)H-dependent oxidoreductase [Granulosicoccaceae bacterium]
MSKTLLVHYTPRTDSNTAKLVQTFIQSMQGRTDITDLDLVDNPPPFLLTENLNALIKRNFMGMELTDAENRTVGSADRLVHQLLEADRVVISFPMYNFSLPAAVKAWIDAIIQLGKTFSMADDGSYKGLCQGKRALILMTTGGDFAQESMKGMDFATPLIQTCMGFMGIESHCIAAYGLNQYMGRADEIVMETQRDIEAYLNEDSAW